MRKNYYCDGRKDLTPCHSNFWLGARDHPHSVLHPLADKIFAPEIVLHTKKKEIWNPISFIMNVV